ncbi:hypothetical protein NVP1238A_76 [Vibrio phage 1.238.A._10N.261.52.F10]|uniref:Uncharacterized protein n=1 Tax=Vibrio phage 1.238.A._10N.261.52.F10 TaxID=1881231 RepID=A0A2I7RUK0_9CAUD|nr:hypothetical protein KNT79_gp76 [Vibrio phage 1.238.A._10N.261.52.F10]AUR97325.1 hypothetical protein NVP1238A_76 [Vibrio phage 1.238.A._10N.261.52.F10]AUR97419.1 hypothetical protein NVP1238B_77 [Vibrio phage 1.238.B._10N.261.52.F10]
MTAKKDIVIPEFCKDSPLYALYLLLEAMPPEDDDHEDLRMHRLYTIIDNALTLQVKPEEILEQMGGDNILTGLAETSLGQIPIKVIE